ncbi:MAG: EAL domain-containing protein [Ilumatobacteraceae bacterium]
MGGDEFAVAVTDHSSTHASSIAERLARSIIEPVEISGRLLRVSASVGVAIGPWDDSSPVAVLGFADQALQRAKELGRDRIEVFGSDMRAIDRRRALDEIELRRALDRGEIQPFFRPEFDVEEGRLIGAEIVARWIREDGSILDERELLTVARDANTVERLAVAVVREARPFLRRLELFGLPTNFRFRIDLPHRCTPRAWRDGQIAAAFVGLDMSRLPLDATAEVVAVDPVHAAELLADLRNRGAQVSLRDLSDLEVLGSIAVDEIRLARSVVRGRRPIDDALLGAVADLAHDLGLQLGAGEVTSIDESHRLVDHGCHRQSGPLFGLPITAEDLAELVEKDLVSHLSSTSMP